MAVVLKNPNTQQENGEITLLDEEKKIPYPKPVFFIVVTEFCERFAYYGMRAVLTIYMRSVLNFSDDLATTIYHIFLFLCYFLPLFGAILADSFVGKYTTVLALSSIFAMGNLLLTAASTPPLHMPMVHFSMAGLALMAIGTGGIKPCVVALGGDQFILPHQERQLKQFFSMFVFAVSVGNMFSTVITPVLRSDVTCFNQDCYPLAFGIPAALMVVAVVIFVSGKPMYKINQPKENIILRVAQCIFHAISQRHIQKKQGKIVSGDGTEKKHWVDYAHYEGSKFDEQLIKDTKGLLRVLVYYLPIPMFWALYEQLGSRWTLQATRMDGNLGTYSIKPDQMQVANAILMFIFIPVFETVLYPLLRKCNIFKRPLQRMAVGGLLAALSFSLAGIIEMRIEKSSITAPTLTESHLNVINTLPCRLNVFIEPYSATPSSDKIEDRFQTVAPQDNLMLRSLKPQITNLTISSNDDTSACVQLTGAMMMMMTMMKPASNTSKANLSYSGQISLIPGIAQAIIVAMDPTTQSLKVYPLQQPEDIQKSREGLSKLRIVNLDSIQESGNLSNTQLGLGYYKLINKKSEKSYLLSSDAMHNSMWQFTVSPGVYQIVALDELANINSTSNSAQNKYFTLETGGNYMLILRKEGYSDIQEQVITVVPPNEVHMLWLLPQYLVMAWAEILFIISGMEFSFTEAPTSMKSVLQSCWHLTNATGNLLVIIAAQNKGHSSQATEFLLFAGLMLIDTVIFSVMASRYKYVSSKYDDVGKDSNCNNEIAVKTLALDPSVVTPANNPEYDAQVTRL